jgi:hypothetical protein
MLKSVVACPLAQSGYRCSQIGMLATPVSVINSDRITLTQWYVRKFGMGCQVLQAPSFPGTYETAVIY